MCTLLAPDSPESKSFDELLKTVQDHVKPPPSRNAALYKFYTLLPEELSFNEALLVPLALESTDLHTVNIQAAQDVVRVPAINKITTAPRGPCFSYGGDHFRHEYKHKDAVCSSYNKKKNYSRNKIPRSTFIIKNKTDETSSDADSNKVGEILYYASDRVRKLCGPKTEVSVQIKGKKVTLQVDTGAFLSLISKETYRRVGDIPLWIFKHRLATYTGEIMKVLGCIEVDIK
ncbi:hypothetical protein E2C01_029380 [Portunus trituberculatus]|uniref:Peptidase A2 domain-containing protein n=1 Tax=Portunus trituberculatus TaxID=210409 RepID=A0A5B7ENB3_PORTR|nr:hypothetical protein [Portunus trituberculatus]